MRSDWINGDLYRGYIGTYALYDIHNKCKIYTRQVQCDQHWSKPVHNLPAW